MNFNSLNKIFEDKFTISKHLLKEEASLKSKKEESKKKLTESIDRNLTERDWKLTIPGSFRDDMLNAGEEEDFDKVKNILIDMCNYVLEHIDESNFDLDDQEYVIEEFEDFIEELEYVDFEDEDEANYYLNDLYDLLDNTDIFLGLREGLNERLVDGEYVPDNSVVVELDGISYMLITNTDGDNLYHFKELGCDDYNILKLSKKEVKDKLLKNGYSNDFIRAEILREGLLNESSEKFIITKVGDGLYALAQGNPPVINDRKKIEANSFEEAKEILLNNGYSEDELVIDESLKEEKITGGDMEQEDINIIQPLIDDFDSLEDANKDVLSITWNFGRRNSDNKMTAGVDIYFLSKDSEENLQPYLKQVEDIILSDGYKFDDSLGYDEDHWKEHMFGDGYHTQIIEDVIEECLTEDAAEKAYWVTFSFGDYSHESTTVYANKKSEVKKILQNQYGKDVEIHSIELDESLNEEFAFRSNDELYDLDKEISDYLNQNDFHGMIDLAYINPNDVPVPSITYEIHMGDWKHEHLFFKQLIQEFMDEKNIPYMMTEEDEDNGSDTYTAYHTIHLMKHKEDESLTEDSGSLTAFMEKSEDFHKAMNNFISTYSAEAGMPTYEVLDMVRAYLRNGNFDYSDKDETDECLTEDTVKQDGKWVNKGKEGTHGKFKTKKEADAQRKAMFANGFNEEYSSDLSRSSRYYGGLPDEPSAYEYGTTMDAVNQKRKSTEVFNLPISQIDDNDLNILNNGWLNDYPGDDASSVAYVRIYNPTSIGDVSRYERVEDAETWIDNYGRKISTEELIKNIKNLSSSSGVKVAAYTR